MILRDDKTKTIGVECAGASLCLGYRGGTTLADWSFPDSRRQVLEDAKPALMELIVEGATLDPAKWIVESVEAEADEAREYVSVISAWNAETWKLRMRVALLARSGGPVNLVVQLAATWQDTPRNVLAHFPFLSRLSEMPGFHSPAHLGAASDDRRSLVWSFHESPPFVVTAPEGQAAGLHLPSEFPWWSNYNNQVSAMIGPRDLKNHRINVKPTEALGDILDIALDWSASGWPGVFHAWKDRVRVAYDLRKYDSEALRWCQRTYLHHFTYAYGTELFNYETGHLEVDRLIDEGQAFGGYDAIIFWHQYPRLGLDARTQWDLYDDLPRGRKSLLEMAERCHARGVRVLLPFKPWDLRADESLDGAAREIERILEETGADGFFLDTMSTIPESFARLARERFPALLFASEGAPREPRQIEQLTSSWDQTGRFGAQVEANLFRFLFPEHPQNMISRWSIGSAKDTLITRAIFNGTGLVIWQDIFGAWLPYSAAQKSRIAKWKSVLSRYHDTIYGQESVPLVRTEQAGILCNMFASTMARELVLSIYNDNPEVVQGDLVRLPPLPSPECAALVGAEDMRIERRGDGFMLCGEVPPRDIAAVLVRGRAHS